MRRKRSPLTWAEKHHIADLYVNKNLSAREIAPIFGITFKTVYLVLDDVDTKRARHTKLNQKQLNDIKTLYVDGRFSISDISEMMSIAYQTVKTALIRMRVKR